MLRACVECVIRASEIIVRISNSATVASCPAAHTTEIQYSVYRKERVVVEGDRQELLEYFDSPPPGTPPLPPAVMAWWNGYRRRSPLDRIKVIREEGGGVAAGVLLWRGGGGQTCHAGPSLISRVSWLRDVLVIVTLMCLRQVCVRCVFISLLQVFVVAYEARR